MTRAVLGLGRPSIKHSRVTASTTAPRNWISSVSGLRIRMYIHFPFFRGRTKSLPRNGNVKRGLGETDLNLSSNIESGALFSLAGTPTEVIVSVGVSFVSGDQACANAASEIGTATFDEIQTQSKALWNEMLSRIEIVVPRTPPSVTELLYSSLYRASLTPVSLSFSKLLSNS